jgi:predicted acyltransferase
MTRSGAPVPALADRLVSLDVFRGLTMAAMVIVNDPGDWDNAYWPLLHAEWNLWTPTDLIFPFFLFIVGISIALSFSRRREEGRQAGSLHSKIVQRSAMIFAIGLFLHLFPRFRFATMRIPGVLQRIAVCFLVGALIYLYARTKARLGIALALLAGTCALMTFVPIPGYGAGSLAPHCWACISTGPISIPRASSALSPRSPPY